MVAAVVGAVLDATVERHAHAEVRAADQPRVVIGQPVVGDLDLTALREGLPEEAELVMDAVTDGRDIHRREGIQEARGQTAEAAVAEAHVGFFVGDRLEVLAELGQRLRRDLAELQVHEVVREHAAHEILEGEIVDAADVLAGVLGLRVDVTLQHLVAGGHARGHPPVVAGGGDAVAGERALQMMQDGVAEDRNRRGHGGLGGRLRLGLGDGLGGRLADLDHLD